MVQKRFMIQCEKSGHANRAIFHDIDAKDIPQCPLSSRKNAVIDSRNPAESIGVHYSECRNIPGVSFVVTLGTRGKIHRVHHPDNLGKAAALREGWAEESGGREKILTSEKLTSAVAGDGNAGLTTNRGTAGHHGFAMTKNKQLATRTMP